MQSQNNTILTHSNYACLR